MSKKQLQQVCLHELLHASIACEENRKPHAKHVRDLTYEYEEMAVRSAEEGLYAILGNLGLTFPPLPKQMPYLRRLRKTVR